MKWGKRGLEENVTDLEERETNKGRHTKFVNLYPHLSLLSTYILAMALNID